jgi:hypothetical protein
VGNIIPLCEINNLKIVKNSDCGIWFINSEIVKKLKNINYSKLSPLGWGIDIITIKECNKINKLVIRDYSIESSQIDFSTNYNLNKAWSQCNNLIKWYDKNII